MARQDQGTFPYVIAPGGWIAGNFVDTNGVYHGFLRSPNGGITTFDVPGEGTAAGQGVIEVKGLTPALEIVGTIQGAARANSSLGEVVAAKRGLSIH